MKLRRYEEKKVDLKLNGQIDLTVEAGNVSMETNEQRIFISHLPDRFVGAVIREYLKNNDADDLLELFPDEAQTELVESYEEDIKQLTLAIDDLTEKLTDSMKPMMEV